VVETERECQGSAHKSHKSEKGETSEDYQVVGGNLVRSTVKQGCKEGGTGTKKGGIVVVKMRGRKKGNARLIVEGKGGCGALVSVERKDRRRKWGTIKQV